MQYWILKTEPNTYSYDDLVKDKKTFWDGIRNYQARNNLKLMKKGDLCLIYHSVGPKEIVGIAKVVKEFYQDPSTTDDRWVVVDIKAEKKLKKPLHLEVMKNHPTLKDIILVKQSRLSVSPIEEREYKEIIKLCTHGNNTKL